MASRGARRELWRIVTGFLSLVLVAAVAASLVARDDSLDIVPVMLTALALVTYGAYLLLSWTDYTDARQTDVLNHQIAEDSTSLQRLVDQRLAEGGLSIDDAMLYLGLIVQPKMFIPRISEHVDSATRTLFSESTYTYMVSTDLQNSQRVVPLTLVKRGAMLDSFKVHQDGRRLSTLESRDAAVFQAVVIRLLLKECGAAHLGEYVLECEPMVLALLGSPSVCDESELASIVTWLESAFRNETHRNRARLGFVLLAINTLWTQAPVLAPVTFGTATGSALNARVVLQRRITPTMRLGGGRWYQNVRENFRQALGATPSAISVQLREASRAMSYHLSVRGPEGTYLARQRFVDLAQRASPMRVDAAQLVVKARNGQRFSHVHIRQARFERNQIPTYVAYFYERLPGSIALPTAAAVAASAVLFIAATISLGYSSGHGNDVIAALLGVPAVLGAFAGFDKATRLANGRVGSAVSIVVTVAISLAGVWVYLQRPVSNVDFTGVLTGRPYWTEWAVLVTVALANLIGFVGAWALRGLVYVHFFRSEMESEI